MHNNEKISDHLSIFLLLKCAVIIGRVKVSNKQVKQGLKIKDIFGFSTKCLPCFDQTSLSKSYEKNSL